MTALRTVLGIAALAALLPATTRAQGDDQDFQSKLDTTLALSANGTVELALVSGEIHVDAGSRSDVRIHAVSERGILRLDASPSRIALDVRSRRGDMGDTRYDVTVPTGTRLILRSVSGDIHAAGVGGEAEVHSVSGDIEIQDVSGHFTVESVSGNVTAGRVAADVRGSTVSGDITLERVKGDVDLQSVSGDIELRDVTSTFVRSETVSGDLTYEGTVSGSGRYEMHTHSGDIRLTTPGDIGALVSVETFSGDIDSAYPITIQPGDHDVNMGRPKRFEFKVGDGSARIVLQTFSGDITLAHR